MKTKYLMLGIVTLLAAGGLWIGRAAWRAHRQLVSLEVRNAPLAEVLRKIERQTWQKIRAEKSVANVRVTLHVTDKPLTDVLDRLAEQAGARWSTLHAVYGSTRALNALDSALRGHGKIEPAGWTKMAPNLPDLNEPGGNETGPRFSAEPNPGAPGPKLRFHHQGPDSASAVGGAVGPGPGKGGTAGGMMLVRRGPNGPVIFQGGSNGQMEIWSPEELVMESLLRPRLGDDRAIKGIAATRAAAAETARKVKGRWTTFLAFRKSSMGVGFGMRTPARPGLSQSESARGKPPSLSEAMHGPNPNERFTRLTPEQRVRRARERLGLREK